MPLFCMWNSFRKRKLTKEWYEREGFFQFNEFLVECVIERIPYVYLDNLEIIPLGIDKRYLLKLLKKDGIDGDLDEGWIRAELKGRYTQKSEASNGRT